jgi:hypothetical protein
MAKVNRTIDEAIDEVFKDYKKAFKVAAQEASEAARDDLYANAVSCLERYYNDYKPESYNRTYSLMDSFVPYVNPVQERGDELLCSAGVEFDPIGIAGTYYGSEIYSPTDPEWIIANFLAGIHPRTDGSQVVGGGNYEDQKYYGDFVPAEEMQRYIDRYDYTFDRNFRRSVSKQILRAMRK